MLPPNSGDKFPNGVLSAPLTESSYKFSIDCWDNDFLGAPHFGSEVTANLCPTVDLKLNGQDGAEGSPVAVNDGEKGTISWVVQNAARVDKCAASGKDTFSNHNLTPVASGSQDSGPFTAPPTSYQLGLTCSPNASASSCPVVTDKVNVRVNCPAASFSVAADPPAMTIKYLAGSSGQSGSSKTKLTVKTDGCGKFNSDVQLSAGPSVLGGVAAQYVFGKTKLSSGEYSSGADFYIQPADPSKPIPKTAKGSPYQITITGSGKTRTADVDLNVKEIRPAYG